MKLCINDNGSSNGSAILIYHTQEQAQKAINQIHGKTLGKNTFEADFLKVAEDILKSGEEKYVEPNIIKREDSQSYNIDPSFRDQFMYRESNELNLSWFDYMEKKPARLHP